MGIHFRNVHRTRRETKTKIQRKTKESQTHTTSPSHSTAPSITLSLFHSRSVCLCLSCRKDPRLGPQFQLCARVSLPPPRAHRLSPPPPTPRDAPDATHVARVPWVVRGVHVLELTSSANLPRGVLRPKVGRLQRVQHDTRNKS